MPEEKPASSAFTGLYQATLRPLQRYLARMLGNPDDAEEIAHDAYMRVYPKMADESARNPRAVLYTTAHRLALNKIKRRNIAPFLNEPFDPETSPDRAPHWVQQLETRQELQRLEDAIAKLPPGCRSVLRLRKIELLSHAEIAERLGIAISTVEKQHARALRLLRAALTAQADEPGNPSSPTQEVSS